MTAATGSHEPGRAEAGPPEAAGSAGPAPGRLLAIDVGLRFGFAVYDPSGRLARYGSRHAANRAVLRRAATLLLSETRPTEVLLEGGGALADIWTSLARRAGAEPETVAAETWRRDLLYVREQRSGQDAKRRAGQLARLVIEWSGAVRPTSLRHDAAEAILAGWWGVLRSGRVDPAAGPFASR